MQRKLPTLFAAPGSRRPNMITALVEKCSSLVEVSLVDTKPGVVRAQRWSASRKSASKLGPFVLNAEIGRGRRCVVHAAEELGSRTPVAIKLIARENVSHAFVDGLVRELRALNVLKHPRIVCVDRIVVNGSHIGLVMPLAHNSDVFQYLTRHGPPSRELALKWFTQLVNVLDFMHARCYAHRDIKPENMLLDSNLDLVLTDFEFCHSFRRQGFPMVDIPCGTPPYCAPECVLTKGPHDACKADVWAAGVAVYTLFSGFLPFDAWRFPHSTARDVAELYMHVLKCPLEFPDGVPPSVHSVLARMLIKDPDARTSSSDLPQEVRDAQVAPSYAIIHSLSVPEIIEVCASSSR